MVANRWVTSAVFAPIRAAALAASQPAWPPPMTMTSNESGDEIMTRLLSRRSKSRKREVVTRTAMFHVKHRNPAPGPALVSRETNAQEMNKELLLTDTEF